VTKTLLLFQQIISKQKRDTIQSKAITARVQKKPGIFKKKPNPLGFGVFWTSRKNR